MLPGGHVYSGQVSNALLNGLGVHIFAGNKGRYEGQVICYHDCYHIWAKCLLNPPRRLYPEPADNQCIELESAEPGVCAL